MMNLTINDIKFGIFRNDHIDFGINNVILLSKHFIQKCRFIKTIPNITHWRNEFKLYYNSLLWINNKNAVKLASFINNLIE